MCGEGQPLSPVLQIKMGEQEWQQIVEDASACQAAVSMLATQDVSPRHNSHLLRMNVLSPAREGGLPEAGRVTAWQLGAHNPPLAEAEHQLPHSPVHVGMGNVFSTQGSLKGLGLTWETAGKVAGGSLTALPASCHTGWDASRGTIALLLQLPKPL